MGTIHRLAPPGGLEPPTRGLTVRVRETLGICAKDNDEQRPRRVNLSWFYRTTVVRRWHCTTAIDESKSNRAFVRELDMRTTAAAA